jgi:phosphotransferase system enzyme I (PtsI)
MMFLKGIAASNGIAIAKAYRLVEPDLSFEKKSIDDNAGEVNRFRTAIKKSTS